MGGNFDIGSSTVMQDVHDAANSIMKSGGVIGAVGFAFSLEVAPVVASAVLLGAGLHGLAYAHEAFIEMAFADPDL